MKSWKDYALGIMGAMLGFFLIRFVNAFDDWESQMRTLTQTVVVLEARLDTYMKTNPRDSRRVSAD